MDYDFIKNLLNPISEKSPCGIDIEETGELYNLEVLAKGREETQFSEAEPPDYKKVLSLARKLLGKSKDLWAVNYLIISFVQIDGLTGAVKGIEFLYELITLFWDNLYPVIDIEDDEPYRLRLAAIETLFFSNSQLMKAIKNFIICETKCHENYSYNSIIEYTEEKNNSALGKIYSSIKTTEEKHISKIYKQFASCLES
jgi:type VI secretion system protein ImpA